MYKNVLNGSVNAAFPEPRLVQKAGVTDGAAPARQG